MYLLLIISIFVALFSLWRMWTIYNTAKHRGFVSDDYIIDIDESTEQTLRTGGRTIKKLIGFIIVGSISLIKIIQSKIRTMKIFQKIFDRLHF